jgi:hypothetical protein
MIPLNSQPVFTLKMYDQVAVYSLLVYHIKRLTDELHPNETGSICSGLQERKGETRASQCTKILPSRKLSHSRQSLTY